MMKKASTASSMRIRDDWHPTWQENVSLAKCLVWPADYSTVLKKKMQAIGVASDRMRTSFGSAFLAFIYGIIMNIQMN